LISRERILSVLKLEEPDRIPVIDEVYITWLGLSMEEAANLPLKKSMRYRLHLIKMLDFDGIYLYLARINGDMGGEVIGRDGENIIIRDQWGGKRKMLPARRQPAPQSGWHIGQSYLIDPPVKTLSDLDKVEKVARDPWLGKRKRPFEIVSQKAPELCLWGMMSSPFTIAYNLRGFEQWIKDMFMDPSFCWEVLKFTTEYAIQEAKAMVVAGADVIAVHDGSASASVISPRLYRTYAFPVERDVIQAIKKEGVMAVLHMCGDSRPNIEKMVETGADGIEPLDVLGGVNVADEKRRIGDKVCLKGGMNNNTLGIGTTEQVVKEAKEIISKGASGGGYILASGNVMEITFPLENVEALSRAAKKYGQYPIQ